jgi:hypothetical protein
MKLYATATSERASKGQGGNKFLDVEFFIGDSKQPRLIGTCSLSPTNDEDGNEDGHMLTFHPVGAEDSERVILFEESTKR